MERRDGQKGEIWQSGGDDEASPPPLEDEDVSSSVDGLFIKGLAILCSMRMTLMNGILTR